jgi:uncharacterized protein (DUF433 family)
MFTHISYNPEVLSGKPHIVGTRLSIEFILELVASGATRDDMLNAYPQLTAEAIEEALRYDVFSKTIICALNKNEELYKRLS